MRTSSSMRHLYNHVVLHRFGWSGWTNMGSGASLPPVTQDVQQLARRPVDASDVTDLAAAKAEIMIWRKEAAELLKEASTNRVQPTGANQARKALAPTASVPENYQKPRLDKPESVKEFLTRSARDNLLFRNCTDHDWEDYVYAFRPAEAKAGDVIIQQGDEGDLFYIVEEGSCEVWVKAPGTVQPVKVGGLSTGSAFGELALMYNTARAATIKASTDCKLWVLDRLTFRGIRVVNMKAHVEEVVRFLSNVHIGNRALGEIFRHNQLMRVAEAMNRHQYVAGDAIITQGQVGDNFFVVLEGQVGIYKAEEHAQTPGKKLTTLGAGSFFGEKALLSDDVRAATVVAETKVLCLSLGRDDFIAMFGKLDEFMQPNTQRPTTPRPQATGAGGRDWLVCVHGDFVELTVLGKGAFGKVVYVQHKKNGQHYALKCQPKKNIVSAGLEEHLVNEVKVMKALPDSPVLAKLWSAFQDNTFIFLVLECCMGGELFLHLRNMGAFPESWAKYYSGCVLLGLGCMHSRGIVYRDLKPENLVLDAKGNLKIVDFGLAKIIHDGKSYTLCGTPDYLAPEVILNAGHTLSVDFWAVGILIYEFVNGGPPFFANDPLDTYEKILSNEVYVPSGFSRPLVDLVKKLLKKQPSKRLGFGKGGAKDVMSHKWFQGVDFDGIFHGKVTPPIVPDNKTIQEHTFFSGGSLRDDERPEPHPEWQPEL